jgi:hypothetical protein
MKILGVDFTSSPKPKKPITCLPCVFDGKCLRAEQLEKLCDFDKFERLLREAGPWVCGIDFPFGLARRFVETIGWPPIWREYVLHARSFGRKGFRATLDEYRQQRPAGDREHKRITDEKAGSISPQKLYGVPVALMFFEGAPRLVDANVTIPHLQAGDLQAASRIVVEAYPGVMARRLLGRRSYKNDQQKKQLPDQFAARRELIHAIRSGKMRNFFDFEIDAPVELADDPSGDQLDALLCAMQAAWAWSQRENRFGAPAGIDPLEGWIADPEACSAQPALRHCAPPPTSSSG